MQRRQAPTEPKTSTNRELDPDDTFCAVLVELVLHLPFLKPLKESRRSNSRAAHVVTAKTVSDYWKEAATRRPRSKVGALASHVNPATQFQGRPPSAAHTGADATNAAC